jgi:hypothetical protein
MCDEQLAAVIDEMRFKDASRPTEEMLDLTLVAARMLTSGKRRYSLDEVLAHFGYMREQLREPPE